MDKASFYKREDIREAIEEAGHSLEYLPAYSPYLNPSSVSVHKLKQFEENYNAIHFNFSQTGCKNMAFLDYLAIIANLGKAPGLDSRPRRGWEAVVDLLDGRAGHPRYRQTELGERVKDPPVEQALPEWAEVDVNGLRIERVRDFGEVYLALALWRRLGLHALLGELFEAGNEQIQWELVACILTVARFCGNLSELEVAERWYQDSTLEDLLGVTWQQVNDRRLYRGLYVLYAHKDALCKHLMERYRDWFGVDFEFLFYDVTSTYFEGQALANRKAKRGYSRDKRPDCKQVNIVLMVTPEGLPIGYEVFDGNRADVNYCGGNGRDDGSQIRPGPSHLSDGSWHGQ